MQPEEPQEQIAYQERDKMKELKEELDNLKKKKRDLNSKP